MISSEDFKKLVARFKAYYESLVVPDQLTQEHIDLKVKHTYHVISNTMYIARKLGLSEPAIQLAKTIALVHDIGRFQQFITFGTFDDRLSVNHADLGVKILHESDFFSGIPDTALHAIIMQSILNHNIPRINPNLEERVLLFSSLIRDADKLDIWEILTIRDVVFKILDQESPDTYEVSDEIYNCYQAGQVVPDIYAETMNDYRLLRLSWIYDMNFPPTFGLIIKRDYATKILAKIPPSLKKDEIANIIHCYIKQNAVLKRRNKAKGTSL
jgi:putative nucleotidyltransferase with HDIG domain